MPRTKEIIMREVQNPLSSPSNGTSNQLEIGPCSPVDVIDAPPKCFDRHEDNNVNSTRANESNMSYQALAHKCSTILQNLLDNLPDDPLILEHEIMLLTKCAT
eukprot:Gb_38991 [translate_table: standard]